MKYFILLALTVGLYSCSHTKPAMDSSFETTVSNTRKALQAAIDGDMDNFEATKMKSERDRATPFFDRAKKVEEYGEKLKSAIMDLRNRFIIGQVTDVTAARDELFRSVKETDEKIASMLTVDEQQHYKATMTEKYKQQFTKETAIPVLELMAIDVLTAEYNAIDVILNQHTMF